jgi:predicted membrane-bound spermidine synthase
MNWILYLVFALSGATSLAFETLWFRQAGLTFGNSVWASSLVLSSFMAGIALGNGIAARYAARLARPILAYAALEVVIAVSGVALVWALPSMTGSIATILEPFFDQPWFLNPVRLVIGFVVLLAPATAMGATLPLVVRALHARDANFGSVLGKLYGTNTLGAMVGAVLGEVFLIDWLGIRGSAFFVGGMGLIAAGGAAFFARRLPALATSSTPPITPASATPAQDRGRGGPLSPAAWYCLAAAFLSGGILLALEVVWFRFLHLFAHGGGLAFSLMLATVLMGIALGGYVGGAWLRRTVAASRHAASLALVSGVVSVAVYWGFESVIAPYQTAYTGKASGILWMTFCLTFPTSLLSGVLFTLVGAALEREVAPDSRATGLLTLFNTFGAGLGSLCAGFILLPVLGMERSFCVLSGLYGIVGLLLWRIDSQPLADARRPVARWFAAAAFVVTMISFPSGTMERDYLTIPLARFGGTLNQVAEIREGPLQTIMVLRRELDGELIHHRLITDGYSMSGTMERNRRYMRLFVYWSVAVRPDPKRALLISYGVGETASALTETASLEHIDIVDISRAILESSRSIHPDPTRHPLDDPRVQVHIEDGRYFLRTTRHGYDLITGEPPPPKIAGVVSLYTREYFQLVYDRLNPGGINTYWLPVHNLTEADSKAIISAYCDVFADCALWSGITFDWMLTGSKNLEAKATDEAFSRQWRDPIVGRRLRTLGIDSPELLGTLFMAGPERLREITRDTPSLVDDFPKRISNDVNSRETTAKVYAPWMDAGEARRRFSESDYIRKIWPSDLREHTIGQFDFQQFLVESRRAVGFAERLRQLHQVLVRTPYRSLALKLMGQDDDILGAVKRLIAGGANESRYNRQLAMDDLARRDFRSAARHFGLALEQQLGGDTLYAYYLYAVCMSGNLEYAQSLVGQTNQRFDESPEGQKLRHWFEQTFALVF